MEKRLKAPFEKKELEELRAGDICFISGEIYSARDAAHRRMYEALEEGTPMPFTVEGAAIYYMGPTPAKPGEVIGSAGPTTSGRMDKFTPKLLDRGLAAMIGKGVRSPEVYESIVKNRAVYFAATGGAGALLSKHIVSSEIVAYENLGAEAVRKLMVKDFPVIVVADSIGGRLY